MAETEQSAYDNILGQLRAHNASFIIHEHVESRTFNDALERLPFPAERLMKSVVFRMRSGGWVLVGLRGQDRVDYRKLADALGVKRSELTQPSPEEVRSMLGVEVGSIAPIPTLSNVQVFLDSNVPQSETLFTGVGRSDRTLEIKLDDLLRVSQGRVAAIAQEATKTLPNLGTES